GDVAIEKDETIRLTLQSVSNAGGTAALGTNTVANGTIVNDDGALPNIAFVAFNNEGQGDLAFVTFKDIAAGTVISFTDNEWNGTAFSSGESVWTWTATSDVAAGSVITMTGLAGTATSNLGTIAFLDATVRGLQQSNEAVYAFQGPVGAPTAFLTAL